MENTTKTSLALSKLLTKKLLDGVPSNQVRTPVNPVDKLVSELISERDHDKLIEKRVREYWTEELRSKINLAEAFAGVAHGIFKTTQEAYSHAIGSDDDEE